MNCHGAAGDDELGNQNDACDAIVLIDNRQVFTIRYCVTVIKFTGKGGLYRPTIERDQPISWFCWGITLRRKPY